MRVSWEDKRSEKGMQRLGTDVDAVDAEDAVSGETLGERVCRDGMRTRASVGGARYSRKKRMVPFWMRDVLCPRQEVAQIGSR